MIATVYEVLWLAVITLVITQSVGAQNLSFEDIKSLPVPPGAAVRIRKRSLSVWRTALATNERSVSSCDRDSRGLLVLGI